MSILQPAADGKQPRDGARAEQSPAAAGVHPNGQQPGAPVIIFIIDSDVPMIV